MVTQRDWYAVQATLAFVAACITLVALVLLSNKGVSTESTGFFCLQFSTVLSFVMCLIAGALHIQSSKG